jgi:hypothetical protein
LNQIYSIFVQASNNYNIKQEEAIKSLKIYIKKKLMKILKPDDNIKLMKIYIKELLQEKEKQ